MSARFADKKVVITGASPDLGQILAIYFSQAGAELFLLARTREKAERTAALVKAHGGQQPLHCYGADLRYPQEIDAFSKQLKQDTSSIDILINNAGYWLQGEFQTAKDADIAQVINTTLSGTVLITKHLRPLLQQSKAADMINIASLSADPLTPEPAHEAYSAAKSAMGLFASRFRDKADSNGIRITTLFPPKFLNRKPLDSGEWQAPEGLKDKAYVTDRQVINAIEFALTQDRICCVNEIHISNNH